MLVRPDQRASASERQRRARDRRRRGEACFRITLPHHDLLDALIRSGRLTEAEAARQQLAERALATVVADWIARWKN